MCRRGHRVPGDQESYRSLAGRLDDVGALLQVLAREDANRLPDHEPKGLYGRPEQARGIELREDGVRRPRNLDALQGDVFLVEQPEADEHELPQGGRTQQWPP